jgi:hypothetical protein
MPDPDDFPDEAEGQDLAEVFDEENITPDGRDIATSDMQRDLFDVTSVEEDADAALEPQDDFDPDAMGEAEWEAVVMADEDLDRPREVTRDAADLVPDEVGDEEAETVSMEAETASLEGGDLSDDDLEALDYARQDAASDTDSRLDEALEETFPASDPVSINPRPH